MSILKRSPYPKPDPAVRYVCLVGHVSRAGSYPEADVRPGDHPGVVSQPKFWADASLHPEELTKLRAERFFAPSLPETPAVNVRLPGPA